MVRDRRLSCRRKLIIIKGLNHMKFVSIVLTFLVVSGFVIFQPVTAQASTATSQLTGLEINLGPSSDAVFLDASPEPYEIDGYIQEDFQISYGTAMIYVSFVQGDVTPQYWHDDSIASLSQELNSFEVLLEDVGPAKSTALFDGEYRLNYDVYTYSEYQVGIAENVNMSSVVHSGEPGFLDNLNWATANITIDGTPFTQHADRPLIRSAVNGTSDIPPRVIEKELPTQADWADSGLISETEWVSPQVGTSLNWDSNLWTFPYYLPNPISIDTDRQEDLISIVTPDHSGQADVLVFRNTDVFTPKDWESQFLSPEWIESNEQNGFTLEIIDSATTENTASVITKLTDGYGLVYMAIYDVYITPEFTIVTHLFSTPEAFGDVYQAYWDGVKANDDFYPLTWTHEEIHALSGE